MVVDLVANSRSFRGRPLSTYGVKKLECFYLADCCPDFSNLCCWSKLRRLIPGDQEKAMAYKLVTDNEVRDLPVPEQLTTNVQNGSGADGRGRPATGQKRTITSTQEKRING